MILHLEKDAIKAIDALAALYTGLEDLCYTPQGADQNNKCDMISFICNAYICVYMHTSIYICMYVCV